jgi:hypothetical protein
MAQDLEQQIVDLRNELSDLRRLLVLHNVLPAHAFGTAALPFDTSKSTLHSRVQALIATGSADHAKTDA